MEQQEPEQPSVTKKPWHKKWWGVLILLGIWPYFLAWWAWTKTEWHKFAKIILTIPAIFALGVTAAGMAAPKGNTLEPKTLPQSQEQPKEHVNPAPEPTPAPSPAAPASPPAPAPAPTPTPAPAAPKPAPAPSPQPKSNCDPNYSGACVPNVYPSDVDCAGGSGNGPYYVQGPVKVIGVDHYHLDSDGDGIGCE